MMKEQMRQTGIEVIGRVPWGTHLCQFYQSEQDLEDILIPYFKQGLADNEFCMWITSEPLGVEEAKAALRHAEPNLDEYIHNGQIEILDYTQWYTLTGSFNEDEVLNGWVKKLENAIGRGYEGLRLSGNTFWLEDKDWADFTTYEETINSIIGNYCMLAICTYSLVKCGAPEIMDVVSNHQFALIKRSGQWQIIESSEHKKTEEALRDSQNRLKTELHTMTRLQELSTVYLNDYTLEPILGKVVDTAIEITGADFGNIQILDPKSSDLRIAAQRGFPKWWIDFWNTVSKGKGTCGTALERGKRVIVEDVEKSPIFIGTPALEIQRKAGVRAIQSTPLVSRSGKIIGMFSTHHKMPHRPDDSVLRFLDILGRQATDIIEHVQAQHTLRQLSQFPEETPNPVLRCTPTGLTLYTNCAARNWLATLGWQTGGPLPAQVSVAVAEALKQTHTFETEITNPVGLTFSFFVVQPPGEEYVNLYGVDITDRRNVEDQLRKANDVLEIKVKERTAKLEVINRELQNFTFVASHDLREPLRKIQTFGNMLITRTKESLDETSVEYINRMRKSAQNMQKLLDSLQTYTYLSTKVDPWRETDIMKSVEAALQNLDVLIHDKGAIIEIGNLPIIIADRVQMISLFQNLIANAIKFQRYGETPRVKIYSHQEESDKHKTCKIYVEDNGIGFEKKYAEKIFDPFQRLQRRSEYEGVGMGLAICRKIVERHGGRITAESNLNKGSVFIVALPGKRRKR